MLINDNNIVTITIDYFYVISRFLKDVKDHSEIEEITYLRLLEIAQTWKPVE